MRSYWSDLLTYTVSRGDVPVIEYGTARTEIATPKNWLYVKWYSNNTFGALINDLGDFAFWYERVSSNYMLSGVSDGGATTVVEITNPNDYPLKDYQVKVKLPTALSGRSISVYDENGKPLNFCYELISGECKATPTNSDGYIWVKVPEIPAHGTVRLIILTGNNGAVDGDKVFDFYDDFDYSTAALWSKYVKTHSWVDVYTIDTFRGAQGVLVIEPRNHHYQGIQTLEDVPLTGNDYIIEYKARTESYDAPKVAIWSTGSVSDPNWMVRDTYPFMALIHEDGVGDTYTWTTVERWRHYIPGYNYKAWRLFVYHVHRDDTSGTNGYVEVLWYSDYGNDQNRLDKPLRMKAYVERGVNDKYYANPGKVTIMGENNGKVYFDWVRIRKYADQEPIVKVITSGEMYVLHIANTKEDGLIQGLISSPAELTKYTLWGIFKGTWAVLLEGPFYVSK